MANVTETAAPPPSPRFAEERQQQIAERLRAAGRVEVAALAAEYGVSEDTIRRDLRGLAARGLVHKTHGGAVAVQTAGLPAAERTQLAAGAKRAIAAAGAALVQPHQTLFVDAGSTTLALAQALRAPGAPRPLTVVTTSLDVANLLHDEPQLRLVLAGGHWQPASRAFEGEAALATLRAHRADLAFLGACALHPRAGMTASSPADAAAKRAMIEGAARRVVLADASKLDTVAPDAVCALAELDLVVCDAAPDWLRAQVAVQPV